MIVVAISEKVSTKEISFDLFIIVSSLTAVKHRSCFLAKIVN